MRKIIITDSSLRDGNHSVKHTISLDSIIGFLKSKKVFTQYAYDIINPMYVKEIMSQLGGDYRFQNINFNVFDFKINTEIDEELDEPINQIQEECLNLEA